MYCLSIKKTNIATFIFYFIDLIRGTIGILNVHFYVQKTILQKRIICRKLEREKTLPLYLQMPYDNCGYYLNLNRDIGLVNPIFYRIIFSYYVISG